MRMLFEMLRSMYCLKMNIIPTSTLSVFFPIYLNVFSLNSLETILLFNINIYYNIY